jgi:two-component system, NarL family, nitrate/nitrite response regulator NarL
VIAIVDDDELFRAFLGDALRLAGFQTLEFGRGEDLLQSDCVPDVAIVDVKLGGISGYEVCRVLRERFGQRLPIVFVSGERCETHDRVAGLLIGSDEYLVKPIVIDELVARIHRLLTRAESDTARVTNGTALPAASESRPPMTNREREVLRLLASGKTQVEIANELFISPHTVATHIQRILEKLGSHSRAEAVALAFRLGLVTTETAE